MLMECQQLLDIILKHKFNIQWDAKSTNKQRKCDRSNKINWMPCVVLWFSWWKFSKEFNWPTKLYIYRVLSLIRLIRTNLNARNSGYFTIISWRTN